MTAILAMSFRDSPVMIGDIMIFSTQPPLQPSTQPPLQPSTQPPLQPLVLPATGQRLSDTPIRWDTHFVTGFCQKLNLIGPHMIIAWAGMRAEARAAVTHLRAGYQNVDTSDLNQLQELFDSLNGLGINNTSLIGLLTDEAIWSIEMIGDVRNVYTPWGERAAAAGTGEDALFESLRPIVRATEQSSPDQAIASALIAASQLWFQDIRGVSTELGFGGAYEIAGIQHKQITKVGDILYAVFGFKLNQGLGCVPIFKRVDYYEDNLIVRVVDFLDAIGNGPNPYVNPRVQFYSIPPVDAPSSGPSAREILDNIPDFNASHFVTLVNWESTEPDQPPYGFTVHKYQVENKPIQFLSESNYVSPTQMSIERSYLKEIQDEVLEHIGEVPDGTPLL